MTYCPSCGRELPPEVARTGSFCPYCGQKLERPKAKDVPEPSETTSTFEIHRDDLALDEVLSDEEKAAVEALPPGSALLIGQRGGDEGSRFLLDVPEVTLGRSPEADIFLDDVTVSRNHAFVNRTDEGYEVTDRGSLNGTYVNRELVEHARLASGDELQVGKYRLLYFLSPRGALGEKTQ